MQRQLEVGAVALVGLDDEPLAAGPLRAGADVGDVAADRRSSARSPASARISISIDVVVVLPCVPATAERSGLGADRRQHPGPAQRRDAESCAPRRARCCVAGIAVDAVTASQPCTTRRSWPTCTSTPAARSAVEHRLRRGGRCRHVVAHLGQRDGDGAHARAADADDVQPPRARTGRAARRTRAATAHGAARSGWTRDHDGVRLRPTRSIRRRPSATAAMRRDPPVAGAPSAASCRAPSGVERAAGRSRPARQTSARSPISARGAARRRPVGQPARRCRVWWSSAAPGHGTRIAGVPVTATSCDRARTAPPDQQVGRGVHAAACRSS